MRKLPGNARAKVYAWLNDNGPVLGLHKCLAVEEWMRKQGTPYVAVDEAKRALFNGPTDMGTFDFVIYRQDGPNLLSFAGCRTARRMALLREWEPLFGKDFRGAFAIPVAGGEVRFVDLDGRDLDESARAPSPVIEPASEQLPLFAGATAEEGV